MLGTERPFGSSMTLGEDSMRTSRPLALWTLDVRVVPAVFTNVVQLGASTFGEGTAMAPDAAGNVVYAGPGNADSGPSVQVRKSTPSGELAWSVDLAQDAPWSIVRGTGTDSAGNVYVSGLFSGKGDFDPGPGELILQGGTATDESGTSYDQVNSFLVKLSPSGNFLWARSLGGNGNLEAMSLTVAGDGRAFVTGQFSGLADVNPGAPGGELTSEGDPDAFVASFAANGAFQWSHAFGGPEYSVVRDADVDAAGNLYVAGTFTGSIDLSGSAVEAPGLQSAFVARFNPDGSVPFARAIGGSGTADAIALAHDGESAIYVIGSFTGPIAVSPNVEPVLTGPTDDSSAFIMKFGLDGTLTWARGVLGSEEGAIGVAAIAADQQGPAITGALWGTIDADPGPGEYPLSAADKWDGFTLTLRPDGTFQSASATGGTGEDRGEEIVLIGNELYTLGSFDGEILFPSSEGPVVISADGGPQAYLSAIPRNTTPRPNQSPTISMPASVSTTEGRPLVLTARVSDSEGDRLAIQWDVNGDGDYSDASGANVNVSWDRLRQLGLDDNSAGRLMTLRVSDGVNPAIYKSSTLSIDDVAPTAKFRGVYRVNEGRAGAVWFAGESDPSSADREAGFRYSYDFDADGIWDLGDGATFGGSVTQGQVEVPANFLANSGTRAIRARIVDKDGSYNEYRTTIIAVNVAPTGKFVSASPVLEGRGGLVRFLNVADPSTADTRAGFRYSYDFGNDGTFDVGNGTTYAGGVTYSVARVPNSYFDDNRSVVVRARVFDIDGGYSEYTTTIQVQNVAPTAIFRGIGPQRIGVPVTFSFGGQRDPSNADRLAGLNYLFDLDGDGRFERTGKTPRADHTFTQSGTHVVRGRIVDKDGGFTDYEVRWIIGDAVLSPSVAK